MCIDRLCFFYIELNFIGAICCSMAILIVNLIPLSLEEVAFNWNIDICRSHSNSWIKQNREMEQWLAINWLEGTQLYLD